MPQPAIDPADDAKRALFSLDGIEVFDWRWPPEVRSAERADDEAGPDVIIAAFQCELPEQVRGRLRPTAAGTATATTTTNTTTTNTNTTATATAATATTTAAKPPLWINLDYLSAEPWVDQSHALPSLKPDGALEWFFLPGFTPASGGLIRERKLAMSRAAAPDRAEANARADDVDSVFNACRPGARRVSVFCYADQPLSWLSDEPADLLITAGCDQDEVRRQFGVPIGVSCYDRGPLRLIFLPWLEQSDYDRLLGGCDLNLVRGEDSWIRAIWAARPFLWRPYPQTEGTDRHKLDAFLDRLLAHFEPRDARVVGDFMRAYQALGQPAALWHEWRNRSQSIALAHARFAADLNAQVDQASRLEQFIRERML